MKNYIVHDDWNIIEKGLQHEYNLISESIFSIGNGYMGLRGNFEEDYSGKTLLGTYTGGIYYPDKTRVGWWKNGYPEYFAKVLNGCNWKGIRITLGDTSLDLHTLSVEDYSCMLNMKDGMLTRRCIVTIPDKGRVIVQSERCVSMDQKELGLVHYTVESIDYVGPITIESYLDYDVRNADANYDEYFWKPLDSQVSPHRGFLIAETYKTNFAVAVGMDLSYIMNNDKIQREPSVTERDNYVSNTITLDLKHGDTITTIKKAIVTHSMNHATGTLHSKTDELLHLVAQSSYNDLKAAHIAAWHAIWETADIEIKGDTAAQQGIRFNIFQLYCTYTGEDARLNIGPKGFTGEKYGGSTYWDTEAYCLPFYLGTTSATVGRNLLVYRHNHLKKAIENAEKLGFTGGAALYPMVTMNGEECHNEWEITFEEIHRNGAIAYAIYDYIRYTGDDSYLAEYGCDVLVGIARFWAQRFNYSEDKKAYVMLGVTGPNEYENNVNNNWYTNYIAKWCLQYCEEALDHVAKTNATRYQEIISALSLKNDERAQWNTITENIYFPYDETRGVYLQQDGFLDKVLRPVSSLADGDYPLHQNWSWDRILRSCFIKQADVLQGMYFFEDQFSKEELERNFLFYEPMTVHESSLSPCIHSILASRLDMHEKAYEMYVRTARLDLDDYNNDTKDGLHITSMAGTWLAVVKGFGGVRVENNELVVAPWIPKEWESYSFNVLFRGERKKITVTHDGHEVS